MKCLKVFFIVFAEVSALTHPFHETQPDFHEFFIHFTGMIDISLQFDVYGLI